MREELIARTSTIDAIITSMMVKPPLRAGEKLGESAFELWARDRVTVPIIC